MVNYDLLNEKIKETGYQRGYIASKMGLSLTSFSYKTNGKRKILLEEVPKFQRALNLTRKDVTDIFFADDVEK